MNVLGKMAAACFRSAFLVSALGGCAFGQVLPVQSARPSIALPSIPNGAVTLEDGWRFQTGDDPRWADPAFDDSAWRTVKLGTQLSAQGIDSYTGYAWYRLRLSPASADASLTLLVQPYGVGEFAVFANGVEAARTQGVDKAKTAYVSQPFSIPLPHAPADGAIQIAIRTWINLPVHHGLLERVEAGDPSTIAERLALVKAARWNGGITVTLLVSFLFMCVAVLGATLFVAQRHHTEYLWLALLCLSVGTTGCFDSAFNLSLLPALAYTILSVWMGSIFIAITLEFTLRFTGDKNRTLVRVIQGAVLLIPFTALMHVDQILMYLEIAEEIVLCGLVTAMLFRAWRRGNSEAGVMLAPFLLAGSADSLDTLLDFAARRHWLPAQFATHLHFLGPLAFSTSNLTFLLFLGSLVSVNLYRFVRVSQIEQRSAAELEAARSVQALLIPTELPSNQNFMLEGAYLPANGVGGDFFQVLPLRDESMLIVVGDVSGKGLRAAMNASTLVGALRNEISQDPATVLNHLNQVMLGATGGNAAFATCLCARIYTDGRMVIANAGHLSPYRDGREMSLAPDLPLGILPGIAYEQAAFQLTGGDRLIFLSDGVVEATNPQGELFGFERTQQVSNESARYIAQTAQRFGQNDDITVVSLYIVPTAAHRSEPATASVG